MLKNLQIILICVAAILSACVRARPVYIENEKKTAQAAIQLFIVRFNREDYDAIYDDANDVFKNANSKENVIPLMKQTREQNGKIMEVTDQLVKVLPGPPLQVRAVYNIKCEKGERSIWFTYLMGINGKATLAEIQNFGAYTDLSKYKTGEIK